MNKLHKDSCCETPCLPFEPQCTDICVTQDACEVQANLTVRRKQKVFIWGIVTDCEGRAVPDALLRLFRHTTDCTGALEEVAHTYSDGRGYYRFELNGTCCGNYRVQASPCPPCPVPCARPACPPPCPPPIHSSSCTVTCEPCSVQSSVRYY